MLSIWAWITSKFGMVAAGISAGIIIAIAIFQFGRKSKGDEVQAATAKPIIKTVKEVRKNEERINNLSGSDLDKQLLRDSRNTGRVPMNDKD